MRTSVISNLKGGVAKTSTAVNVASILAHDYQQRVLLVDADSQCNSTEFFGGDPAQGNLADVLRYQGDDVGAYAANSIQPSRFPGVDLLAGDDALMDLDLTQARTDGIRATALQEMLVHIRSCWPEEQCYHTILVDCPPAFNAASTAALIAADDVIVPIKLDAFSLRGMANLIRQVDNMRRINPQLRLAGCLPVMWYNSPKIRDAEAALRASGFPVFPCIRRTDKVDDMTFAQDPLIVSSPRSAACVDYRRFVGVWLEGGVRRG